jgi:Golgi phosphoprotein 3 (GPP34)
MGLAEDLVILAVGDRIDYWSEGLEYALAGACLIDLKQKERITFEEDWVVIADSTPCDDLALDALLERISNQDQPLLAAAWIARFAPEVGPLVLSELHRRGMLEVRATWGWFELDYEITDVTAKEDLRNRLSETLAGRGDSDDRSATLLRLCYVARLERLLPGRPSGRKLRRQIKDWGPDQLVHQAVARGSVVSPGAGGAWGHATDD